MYRHRRPSAKPMPQPPLDFIRRNAPLFARAGSVVATYRTRAGRRFGPCYPPKKRWAALAECDSGSGPVTGRKLSSKGHPPTHDIARFDHALPNSSLPHIAQPPHTPVTQTRSAAAAAAVRPRAPPNPRGGRFFLLETEPNIRIMYVCIYNHTPQPSRPQTGRTHHLLTKFSPPQQNGPHIPKPAKPLPC